MPPLLTTGIQSEESPPTSPGVGKSATYGKFPPLVPPRARASSEILEATLVPPRVRATSEIWGRSPRSFPYEKHQQPFPEGGTTTGSPKSVMEQGRARSYPETRPRPTKGERRARCRSASNVDELWCGRKFRGGGHHHPHERGGGMMLPPRLATTDEPGRSPPTSPVGTTGGNATAGGSPPLFPPRARTHSEAPDGSFVQPRSRAASEVLQAPLLSLRSRASSEVIKAPSLQPRGRASSEIFERRGQHQTIQARGAAHRSSMSLSEATISPASIMQQGRGRSDQELRLRQTKEERRARCRSTSNIEELRSDPKMKIQTLVKTLPKHIRKNGDKHASTAAMYNEMGNAYFRTGQNDAAIKAYRKAVACEPGEQLVSAYSNLATVHWRQGQVAEAIGLLQQAWDLHELQSLSSGKSMLASPTAADICHQLGLCHSLSGDFDRALHYLEEARKTRVRIAGGTGSVPVGRTMDAIGKVHWMRGDLESAMQCHAWALACLTRLHAPTIGTLQNMARVHVAANRVEAAVSVLGEIAKVQRMNLAQAAQGSSGREEASKALHQTLDVLADLHVRMDQRDQANRYRQEASLLQRKYT